MVCRRPFSGRRRRPASTILEALDLRSVKVAALVLLLMLTGSTPTPEGHSVLRDLDKLFVEFTHLAQTDPDADEASEVGIDGETIVREASLALSRSGLVVLSAESYRPETPFLSIVVTTLELPDEAVILHVTLELQEEVRLARDDRVSTYGSTWYSTNISAAARTALHDEVAVCVESLLDEFLAEWATVP